MLYGGLRLRDTESIQVNTNSMGTTRMRKPWVLLHRKRPARVRRAAGQPLQCFVLGATGGC